MELLRKTGTKRSKCGWLSSYGIFMCPKCGNEVEMRLGCGRKNKTCGCTKHGLSYTRIYKIWQGIKVRCFLKGDQNYKRYGGGGISLCDEWMEFKTFYKWAMENGYDDSLTIDRIDNDGNYEPNNCRFVTQAANTRNTRRVKLSWVIVDAIRDFYRNGGITQREIGNIFGVTNQCVSDVINMKRWVL